MTEAVCIVGIDPGLKGGVAFYFPGHPALISADDMPVVNGEVNAAELGERLRQMRPAFAVVELVHAMPKQGVSSTFKFGEGFGIIKGALGALEIPIHLVAPGRWKKHFRLSSDKEASRAAAIRLWPSSQQFARKKDEGRAEAALLARFGAETIAQGGGE